MDDYIFSLISRESIEEVLSNLNRFTNLPIKLISASGETLLSFGEIPKYCSLLQKTVFSQEDCLTARRKGGEQAFGIGETYIFSCHANMNNIAFSLTDAGSLLGSIIIGPFLMDTPDSTVVTGLSGKYTPQPALSLELYDCLHDIAVIPPSKVNNLMVLLDYLLSSLIPAQRAVMLKKQEQLYQQSRINEAIQAFKFQPDYNDLQFRYEKEKELLHVVKTGDISAAKAILNELMGNALFFGGGTIEALRPEAVELTAILSRVAMDGGAKPESIYELNAGYISVINREDSIEELCATLNEVAESFIACTFYARDKGNQYIRKSLHYISENYSRDISLESISNYVNLSAGYFSSLFNSTLNMSVKDYLNTIRIDESKRLLQFTESSPAEIAVAVGYPDQSYFCRVFKRLTGTTPLKYRNNVK